MPNTEATPAAAAQPAVTALPPMPALRRLHGGAVRGARHGGGAS